MKNTNEFSVNRYGAEKASAFLFDGSLRMIFVHLFGDCSAPLVFIAAVQAWIPEFIAFASLGNASRMTEVVMSALISNVGA